MGLSRYCGASALYTIARCLVLMGALWLGAEGANAAGATAQSVQNTVNSDAFRTSFVQTVYQKLLGRTAQPEEVAPLTTQLKSGGKAWQNVVTNVAGSEPYFEKAGSSNAPFVNNLFQDLVGRSPDAGEEVPAALDYLKGGGSRSDLAGVLADTDEFRANWTQIFYQKLLGRAATNSEATAGTAKLKTGGVSALVSLLLASPEYFQKSGGSQTGWQNAVNEALLAPPTELPDAGTQEPATGGVNDGGINGGGINGGNGGETPIPDVPIESPATLPINNSRSPMVQALLASPEYFSNVVQGCYQKFLKRAATPTELQQATSAMQGGSSSDQVMMTVLTSDEYFNRAGGTTTGYLARLSQDLLGKSGTSLGKGNLPSTGDLLDLLRNLRKKK